MNPHHSIHRSWARCTIGGFAKKPQQRRSSNNSGGRRRYGGGLGGGREVIIVKDLSLLEVVVVIVVVGIVVKPRFADLVVGDTRFLGIFHHHHCFSLSFFVLSCYLLLILSLTWAKFLSLCGDRMATFIRYGCVTQVLFKNRQSHEPVQE